MWSDDASQDYTLHFVVEFDQPIKRLGGWLNNQIQYGTAFSAKDLKETGLFAEFDAAAHPVVQVRSSLSLVSIANTAQNL